jgi:hypothetical protein
MSVAFELPFAAVDLLSIGLGIDCRLFPFQVPSAGYYLEDRIRIAHEIWDELRRRGLADETDLDPEVERALRVFGRPQVAVAVTGRVDGGRQVNARASASGRHSVLVTQGQDGLRFEVIRPEALVHSVVGLLPRYRPGPGTPVTTTRRATRPQTGAEQPFSVSVRITGPPTDAAHRAMSEILRRQRRGGGLFVVSGPESGGREHTAHTLGWVDTDAGRYLTMTGTDQHGDTRTTFLPADETRVVHKLRELCDAVRPPVSRPW